MAGRYHRCALLLLGLAGCPQFQNDDWTVTTDASSEQPAGDAPRFGVDADAQGSDATVQEAAGADAGISGDGAAVDQAATSQDGPESGMGADADAGMGPETQPHDASTSDGGVESLYCGLTAPRGITLFGSDVCWVGNVSPRGLFCAPAAGGGNMTPLAGPNDSAWLVDAFDLLLDATYVYWSNGQHNQVVRRLRAGGQPEEYFSGGGRLSFLTPGDGATIWATDFPDPSDMGAVSVGEVVVGPADGGTASNAIYNAQTGAAGVAVYNGNVYWGMPDGIAFGSVTGNAMIYRIASTQRPVTGVAVDTAGVAYFLAGNRSLYRYATGTQGPKPMYTAPQTFGAGDVAVDDTYVYFSEPDLGCIMRIAK